jgi:hypothetical protein
MKFKLEHTFKNIALADYERLYFDEELATSLCSEVQLARSLLRRETKDGHFSRVLRMGPQRELPAPAAKVFGAKRIEYTEYIEYDLGSYKGQWRTVPDLLTNKITCEGTFRFAALGSGVNRVVEGQIEVNVFGVGSLVEKIIVADIEKSYERAAAFTQRWIDSGTHKPVS